MFRTDVRSIEIMRKIGISETKLQQLDDITFVMNPDQFDILREQVPYLVAMSVSDITEIPAVDFEKEKYIDSEFLIPEPK